MHQRLDQESSSVYPHAKSGPTSDPYAKPESTSNSQLDSYRSFSALAETVNGYYKAELVRGPARPGRWKGVDDLELATLGWVHWHNNQRLHGYLDDQPPAEFEKAFYAAQRSDQALVEIQ